MSRSQGQKLQYHVKGLVTRNTHVRYESPITSDKKVMAKVQVFLKVGQTLMSKSRGQNYGTMWKVLSQGIQMCNMKVLSLLVRKLWPRLKFLFTHHTRTGTPTQTVGLWHKLPVQLSQLTKNYGTMWKVLSQGIHICNIKDLSLVVGWLVVLRMYVASAVFQPYRDLEAGDTQSYHLW